MRLTALNPRWLIHEGRRVGFIFNSPADASWVQSCYFEMFPIYRCQSCKETEDWECTHSQMGIVKTSVEDWDAVKYRIQPCRPDFAWKCAPAVAEATFDNITVHPSIDGSAGGLWHGWIRSGEATRA